MNTNASNLLRLVALAAVAVSAATAVSVPNKPSVSFPLYEATINWMAKDVPAGTPAPAKYEWPFNSPAFLPWTDDRIRKMVPGCAPEQVHLGYWSEPSHVAESNGLLSVLVSWTTCDSAFGLDAPKTPLPTDKARSEVWTRPGGSSGRYVKKTTGIPYSYVNAFQNNKAATEFEKQWVGYASPIVHHVLLKGLKPGESVEYAIPNVPQLAGQNATTPVGSDQFAAGTFFGSFTVPKSTFPFKVSVVGDAGQMDPNATVALQNLVSMKPDLSILLGDNAYHDDPALVENADGVLVDEFPNFSRPADLRLMNMIRFYSPRWESFHRSYSRFLSSVPTVITPGNHELNGEPILGDAPRAGTVLRFQSRFKDYNAFWPSPQYPKQTRDGPTLATLRPVGPVETETDQATLAKTGMQNRNMYHAHAIPGVGTIISLTNYILWENYGVEQLEWLKAQLASIDRAKFPWLVVIWHAGFYTSFSKHYRESECMRRQYEPWFRKYSVDVAFGGHTHSYERTFPMYAWRKDDSGCGIMHVNLGGGCADDVTHGYLDEESTQSYLKLKPKYCPCKANLTAAGTCPAPNPTAEGVAFNKRKPCPFAYCRDPKQFLIPAYQPPGLADGKYAEAPACAKPTLEFPDPLCGIAPGVQPEWSANRRTTFGVGQLELLSPTKARWSWYANNFNLKGPESPTDTVLITRDPSLVCSPP